MHTPASLLIIFATALYISFSKAQDRPNIVVIVSDDQGYADTSYNSESPSEVRTPHLDSLAAESVICTNGYASGHVCSPTRAGLMTGRYQQRFGVYTAGEGGSGMPLEEVWIPTFLKESGYVSGAIGKWHLGLTPEYNAVNRGFDEFYGFMGRGAHPYFDHSDPEHPIMRGLTPIKEKGYLTTRLTEEAVDFIDRQKEKPFFLYLAYNAVHSPAEAPEEDIKPATDDPTRNTLLGMLKHLDLGVRDVVGKLKEEGLFENTLLIYLSDNGGSKAMSANNAPLRGYKQEDFEGGIRVPFIVSWPARLKGGTTCDVPVWSTDILPTILAAAEIPSPSDRPLDGKNMLPALTGETGKLHDHLFWSSGGQKGTWAVRSDQWKLTGVKGESWLYDLESDVGETTDLAAENPKIVAELKSAFDNWIEEMAEPLSGQPKVWSASMPTRKNKKSDKDKEAERAKRKAQKKAERNKSAK
ncbi:sulfatase-like hydrolase/transferase [Verrucomicrobiales bacterium]|nr:sulfatase-like hydrolase/transferase [Verrucomicrobiales bacterium]